MIYGRNYLTGLQSAARLQHYYCRPADRKYEGLTGETVVYLLCLMIDISPDHYSLITAREVSSLETSHPNMLLLPTQAFHRKIPVITSPLTDGCPVSTALLHRAEWKTMLAREDAWCLVVSETIVRDVMMLAGTGGGL